MTNTKTLELFLFKYKYLHFSTSFGKFFASFTPAIGSMNHSLARNHGTQILSLKNKSMLKYLLIFEL